MIVTTPQDVALLDSRKSVSFSNALELPVLGIVENMAGFVCPHCKETVNLFKIGGGEKAANELGVPFLGRVPIDPNVVDAGDNGMPLIADNGSSPASEAFEGIIDKILEKTEKQ